MENAEITNIQLVATILKKYTTDQLYRNSLFLVFGRVLNVSLGFLFWLLAAKMYSIEDIGIATSLVSSLSIIILFSQFGFDTAVVRFISNGNRKNILNTCIVMTILSSLIIGINYISLIELISPNLIFIQTFEYSIIYLFVVIMYSITTTCGNIFTGLRKADMYLFQNILLTSRIFFLLPLVSMGSLGIYSSMGLAYVFSSMFSLYSLEKLSGLNFRLDKRFIKSVFNFSFGNYLANVFDMLPILILPIIALNLLGEAESAKCFIAFAIGNLVLIVPEALSMSVLVEGSHGENLRNNVKKAGVTIYTFLVPAVLFLYIFGTFILSFFGKNYIEAYQLLRLIILSSFFVVVYTLYKSIMNVNLKVKNLVKIVLLRFILILGLGLVLIKEFGINGIGYAWVSSHVVLCLMIGVVIKKKKNINFKNVDNIKTEDYATI